MATKLHIKKGDMVLVISGASKSDTPARVLSVDRNKMRAVVEGANMVSVHTKPNAQYPQGGIIKKEAGIHISNLSLVDPETGGATRYGRMKDNDGNTVRYAKKSGKAIK